MVSIAQRIQYVISPTSRALIDWIVYNRGDGEYIKYWSPELGPQPTAAELEAAELPATKAQRVEADRTECRNRLTEFYGDALEQVSRASGLYGATAQANHAAGVSAAIDASNVARDLINAATTVAEVEAVTVAWPVLI